MKMKAVPPFFLIVAAVVSSGFALASDGRLVTCGSAIKLRHVESKKYFLKSSGHQFQSSGQQIVTLDTRGDPASMLWQVREDHNATTCATGQPIKCGDTVRLTHLATKKNLHSHSGLPAPLSRYNNEVSGFGKDGEGDGGDNWVVHCVQRKDTGNVDSPYWDSSAFLRLLHAFTKRWLMSSPTSKFNPSNCPHCPIHGELEVSASNRNGEAAVRSSLFQADAGVYLRH